MTPEARRGGVPGASRILGVGHIAVDLMFEVQAIPTQPVKTPARRHRQAVGGMTANACVAASRLGAQVEFASPIGDDDYAAVFERHLLAEGVGSAGLQRVPGHGSSVSAIVIDERGERLIVNCRGSALEAAPAWPTRPALQALTDSITQFDVLLVDPRCPTWAEHVLLQARAHGIPAIFDGDVAPAQDLARLAGLARWAVFSLPGLQALCGTPPGASLLPAGLAALTPQQAADALAASTAVQAALDRALAAGAAVAVVTLGELGLLWRGADGDSGYQPAFAVTPVVDTLAAGDVFHGALGVALAEGQPARSALRFAAAAAGLKCLHPGGVLGAPTRAAVEDLLAGRAG